jgi:hypothetical protein
MEVEFSIVHNADIGEVGGGDNVPKGRSIGHHIFNNQKAVFMLFDIETAGEIAGIIQISAEIFCLKMNNDGRKKVGSDCADDVERVGDKFNSYVNPEVRQEYWDQRSISVQYHFFQPTMWDGVMVCLSRGAYKANVHVILLRLHEHKLITFQITMPWTEKIGIALTTRRQSARTDIT